MDNQPVIYPVIHTPFAMFCDDPLDPDYYPCFGWGENSIRLAGPTYLWSNPATLAIALYLFWNALNEAQKLAFETAAASQSKIDRTPALDELIKKLLSTQDGGG